MKPPIASPHETFKPVLPLTGRVEWNDERDCFVFRYVSPFRGRLRCEFYTGFRHPMIFLGVTLGLPLTVLILGLSNLTQRAKRPCEFSVYSWGFQDSSTEMTLKSDWKNIKRTLTHHGDFIAWRRSFWMPGCYLCRENFADEAEALRLQQIIQLLQSQNGANWEAVKQQFKI